MLTSTRIVRSWLTLCTLLLTLSISCGRARYLEREPDGSGGASSLPAASGGAEMSGGSSSGGTTAAGGTRAASGGEVNQPEVVCPEIGWGGAATDDDCLDQALSPTVESALAGTKDADGAFHPELITQLEFYDGRIEGIECLPNLKRLSVSQGYYSTLSPDNVERLATLRRLESLALTGVSPLDFLECMPELENLSLGGFVEMTDLTPLIHVEHLKKLLLHGGLSLGSLEPLAALKELRSLTFFDVSHIGADVDSSFLTSLKLEKLYVFHALGIIDVSQLNTSRLKRLDLHVVTVTGLELLGPPAAPPGYLTVSPGYETQGKDLCQKGWCTVFDYGLNYIDWDDVDCSMCMGH